MEKTDLFSFLFKIIGDFPLFAAASIFFVIGKKEDSSNIPGDNFPCLPTISGLSKPPHK
ncbi:MAG: hypothetical protein JW734_01605 [Candidatus Omnitrophica bacterium]|nr:hypothetical protein [Candidatus Omnitrophota bacterium]